MNLSQAQTLLGSWLDDTNAGYFTAAQTLVWLNLAQKQVQMRLLQAGQNWYQQASETLTVLNQADYLFPSDFMQEHRIEIVLSGTGTQENRQALSPMTTNQQDLCSIVCGTPSTYAIKKDRFTLYPTPSQQWTMRIYYSYAVQDLVNPTDVPDIPLQFHEYWAILAAFDGFIKDDRGPENLIAKKEKYEQLLKQMANDRTMDVPRQVVMVSEYDYGSWF